jgi:hypothetical protein
VYPLATNRALHFFPPFGSFFMLKTHLLLMVFAFLGRSVRVQVWFFFMEFHLFKCCFVPLLSILSRHCFSVCFRMLAVVVVNFQFIAVDDFHRVKVLLESSAYASFADILFIEYTSRRTTIFLSCSCSRTYAF